ncbi:MAG TPA: HTTM domain-containing protein [Vicinamibacteria bacterium]|nr:HTTM domain-containing protein [Vicinamibacteria bacterium]
MTVREHLRAAWDSLWFAPGDARTLALVRVVVSAQALWVLLSRDLPALSGLPAPFWRGVSGPARARFLIAEGHPRWETLAALVAGVALLAVMLGLWTRVSALLAGLLLYHLAPLETLILTPSPYVKGFTIAVPALVVLSVAPCANAWSLRPPRRQAEAWEYHWPVQLVRLLVAQVYLFSGWAKLVRVGLDWAAADNVRAWLHFFNQRDQLVVFNSLGPWLAERPVLCLLAGAFTMGLELSFVAALVWRVGRRVLPAAAAAWHVGILFAMNIAFPYVPLLLVFVDLRRRPESAVP